MQEPWICMDCSARNAAAGHCATCGEGPLLDGRDALVRATLVQQDGERARKRGRQLLTIAAAFAGVLGFPAVFFLGLVGLPVAVGIGAAIFAALRLAFPAKPRFADLA